MKTALVVSSMLLCLALGVVFDRLFLPNPTMVQTYMPIRLIPGDMGHLAALTHKGDTYTRFAEPSGAWGIVAVRQGSGVWVVLCQEVGARVAK